MILLLLTGFNNSHKSYGFSKFPIELPTKIINYSKFGPALRPIASAAASAGSNQTSTSGSTSNLYRIGPPLLHPVSVHAAKQTGGSVLQRQDKPLTRQTETSSDPAVIRKMFAHVHAEYVAMPTGSITGVSVLDIDVEKDCDGVSGFEWLNANRGLIPQTRTVQTPSGGLHYVLGHIEGLPCSNNKIAQRVDVRGDGGYVIVSDWL